jgi:hypothetical protein
MQHALTIRIVALAVLILAVGVGATSYLSSSNRTQDAAARANVSAAVHATAAWYQDPYGGRGSYKSLDTAELVHEAPAVSSRVRVTVLSGGRAFCLADVESRGHSAYYLGGETSLLRHFAGAAPYRVTLVRSPADAATVCAGIS